MATESVPGLPSICPRRLAGGAAEEDVEVFGVAETEPGGNRLERELGLGQQLFRPLDLNAHDLVVGRSAQQLFKVGFERASGERDRFQNLSHADAVAGMLADETDLAHRLGRS